MRTRTRATTALAAAVMVLAVCTSLLVPLAAVAPGQLTGSSRFQEGSHEVAARLTREIDRVLVIFQSPDDPSADVFIDQLASGDARAELFRMEALLRLYWHKFPKLAGDLTQVKALEDGLGAYRYAVDSLTFAKDDFAKKNQARRVDTAEGRGNQSVLDGLERKRVAAHRVLADLLQHNSLVADLTRLRSQIGSQLRGWGTANDTPFVKNELRQMLTKIRDDKYDFTRLEDGIHEFRRQLRWFPMTIDGLDGLVVVRDDAPGRCPAPKLEALAGTAAARHKYANPALAHPASHPCTISRCLMWQVSKTIRDLGRLQDEAQGNAAIEAVLDEDFDASTNNAASPDETARATDLRRELKTSGALDRLMSQISSCKS